MNFFCLFVLVFLAPRNAKTQGSPSEQSTIAAEKRPLEPKPSEDMWPKHLSLGEAVAIARSRSALLLMSDAELSYARGEARNQTALINPYFSFAFGRSIRYSSPEGCDSCSPWLLSFGLSDQGLVVDILSGKRGLRSDLGRSGVDARAWARRDVERTLIASVKSQYMTVLSAKKSLDFQTEIQQTLNQTFSLSKLKYPKTINEGELSRIEAEKLNGDQNVEMARQNYLAERTSLCLLLGYNGEDKRVTQSDSAPSGLPELWEPELDLNELNFRTYNDIQKQSLMAWITWANEHRSDIFQAKAELNYSKNMQSLVARSVFPDVALSVQYMQQGTGSQAITPPLLTFGVGAPLPIFSQKQGEKEKALADIKMKEANLARIKAQVSYDLSWAYSNYISKKETVLRMQNALLPVRKKAFDIVKIQFQSGFATLTDFLDAQRSYIQTVSDYSMLLGQYWKTVFFFEGVASVTFAETSPSP